MSTQTARAHLNHNGNAKIKTLSSCFLENTMKTSTYIVWPILFKEEQNTSSNAMVQRQKEQFSQLNW